MLGAILLNPASGGGSRTVRHLLVAQDVLGCETTEVANLFPVATASMRGIGEVGEDEEPWLLARPAIVDLLLRADQVLLGWGIAPLSGPANRHLRSQIQWVEQQLVDCGSPVWSVGGTPRHPSRWHQFVSDVHGRTAGGTFRQRIEQSLTRLQ